MKAANFLNQRETALPASITCCRHMDLKAEVLGCLYSPLDKITIRTELSCSFCRSLRVLSVDGKVGTKSTSYKSWANILQYLNTDDSLYQKKMGTKPSQSRPDALHSIDFFSPPSRPIPSSRCNIDWTGRNTPAPLEHLSQPVEFLSPGKATHKTCLTQEP